MTGCVSLSSSISIMEKSAVGAGDDDLWVVAPMVSISSWGRCSGVVRNGEPSTVENSLEKRGSLTLDEGGVTGDIGREKAWVLVNGNPDDEELR